MRAGQKMRWAYIAPARMVYGSGRMIVAVDHNTSQYNALLAQAIRFYERSAYFRHRLPRETLVFQLAGLLAVRDHFPEQPDRFDTMQTLTKALGDSANEATLIRALNSQRLAGQIKVPEASENRMAHALLEGLEEGALLSYPRDILLLYDTQVTAMLPPVLLSAAGLPSATGGQLPTWAVQDRMERQAAEQGA